MHVTSRPQYCKAVVESEKRLQQVLFIEELPRAQRPHFWIFGWQKNIVYVNNDSLIQSRKYFQVLIRYVTAGFEHMTRVNEKNIVLR